MRLRREAAFVMASGFFRPVERSSFAGNENNKSGLSSNAAARHYWIQMGCGALLWAQRTGIKAALRMHGEQIRNALPVWGGDPGPEAAAWEVELPALLK